MARQVLLAAYLLLTAPPAPAEATASDCDVAQCRTFSKAASVEEAFLHLQIAIGALNERAQFDKAISTSSRTSVHAQINELQEMFITGVGVEATDPEYFENLDIAANAIAEAAGEEDPQVVNQMLDLLQRDLQLKLVSARATMGVEGARPRKIPVVIVTKRGNTTVTGYRIKLGDGLYPTAPPRYTFDMLSNPETSRPMTPGIYYVYAYLGGALAGKELLDIGTEGQPSVKLDLQVR